MYTGKAVGKRERERGVNDGDGLSNPLKPTVISVAIIN